MAFSYVTPSIEAGEAIRRLHALRWWLEIRTFHRCLFPDAPIWQLDALTACTINVWEHPERFR